MGLIGRRANLALEHSYFSCLQMMSVSITLKGHSS